MNVLDTGTAYYRQLVNDHLKLIERQCLSAVKRQLRSHPAMNNPVNVENEALELSNLVLDTLQKDDYHVLRQFKGNAKLSTYITAIIARKAVDQVRKKLGRKRGEKTTSLPPSTSSESNPVVKNGFIVTRDGEEGEEIIIPDTRSDPEELLIAEQGKEELERIVHEVIDGLSGEERLILRMRFPADEEERPQKIDRVSRALGISEKAVYKRIARLMEKCRDSFESKGVTVGPGKKWTVSD